MYKKKYFGRSIIILTTLILVLSNQLLSQENSPSILGQQNLKTCATEPASIDTATVQNSPQSALSGSEIKKELPQIPELNPDTNILKRTPNIDGIIEDGEWDIFYSFNLNSWDLKTFLNWDDRYIYCAVKSSVPVDSMVLIDALADGWFHGEDNIELRALRSNNSISLLSFRYDSKYSISQSPILLSKNESDSIYMRTNIIDSIYNLEMKIPSALIRGFQLKAGRKTGIQIAVKSNNDETGWVPASVVGNKRECNTCILTDRKVAVLKPLTMALDLKQRCVARGDELVARLHINNDGVDSVNMNSIIIAGEGKAGEYLSSQKIRVEEIAPKKRIIKEYRTLIPKEMPLGSWAIGAEIKSNNSRLGAAIVSFDVVEPIEARFNLPNKKIRADAKELTLGIAIKNNLRNNLFGKVKIKLPSDWEIWKGVDSREFYAKGNGIETAVEFKVKPPIGVVGKTPIKAEITINDETIAVNDEIEIISSN